MFYVIVNKQKGVNGEHMKEKFKEKLFNIIDKGKIKVDESLKKHTTFHIGGNADYFIEPESVEELVEIVKLCKEEDIPFSVLGNGSNILVSDDGYRGVIIKMKDTLNNIHVSGTELHVEAGALLSRVSIIALEYGFSGFEFAIGIPGTIGGAVVMNAGAYGGQMEDVVSEVTLLDDKGIITLTNEELDFGYRTSAASLNNRIVLSAKLKLINDDKELIEERMDYFNDQRKQMQPLDKYSAGSTFKRPTGYFAGKLISDAGLKGYSIGGAEVSNKHGGFIINQKDATAKDVTDLIDHVVKTVNNKWNVLLEPEVVKLGEFKDN